MNHSLHIDGPLRHQHLEAIARRLPEHLTRLSWSAAELRAERQRGLRETLTFAKAHSPWHGERLAAVDPAGFTESDLAALPVMTKADVMANWDRMVTDQRLTLAGANDHITAKLKGETEDYYLLDRYEIFATGGSSGSRGVFIWSWEEFIEIACATFRYQLRDAPLASLTGRRVLAVVEAGETVHGSPFLFSVTPDPEAVVKWFPASTPIGDLVAALNAAQPSQINGFASAVQELAGEALAGRLKIAPHRVSTNSEPLLPEARAAVRQAWGLEVNNMWGCVEVGLIAVECDAHEGMHLNDDLIITEFVDRENRPVKDTEDIAKVLVTSLFNRSMPMIRYELTDVAIPAVEPCSCGSAYPLIAEVRGRADDAFRYPGGLAVHPMVFRTPLGQHPMIEQYQVRQTAMGAAVKIVTHGPVELNRLKEDLKAALKAQGLPAPAVTLQVVEALARHKETGKLKRFVPLPA